jgi:uncharacterized coiled-coil DUF342 family protein
LGSFASKSETQSAVFTETSGRNLSRPVRQLQSDTENELIAVLEKLQGISSKFDTRLGQQSRSNHEVTAELTGKILEVMSDVDTISGKVNHLSNDKEMVTDDLVKSKEKLQKR